MKDTNQPGVRCRGEKMREPREVHDARINIYKRKVYILVYVYICMKLGDIKYCGRKGLFLRPEWYVVCEVNKGNWIASYFRSLENAKIFSEIVKLRRRK